MKANTQLLLAGLLVAVSFGLVQSADAWTRSSPMTVWRVMPVTFVIDSSRVGAADGGPEIANAAAALDTAIANWNGTGSNWTGVRGANVTRSAPDNGINEVYWLRTWDPALGDVNSVLAVADGSASGVGPEFTRIESDVVFNGDRYDWATGAPVARRGPAIGATTTASVMTHEVGHGLGIGHSEVMGAIMYFRANREDAALHPDDRTAARTLYPPGGPLCTSDAQCPIEPGTSSRCSPTGVCESVPPGELGAPCDGGAMRCGAGLFCAGVGEAGAFRCTRDCATQADCTGTTFCVTTAGDRNLCFPPGTTPVGGACTFVTDCQSGICASDLCRAPCTGDDCECEIGDRCTSAMAGVFRLTFCFPGGSTCVRCGDGMIGGTEMCDDGEGNSDLVADSCRSSCMSAACGDGVIDTGEVCDDGNTAAGDGCADCATEPDAGVAPGDGGAGTDGGGTDGGPFPDGATGSDGGAGLDGGVLDGGLGPRSNEEVLEGGCSCDASQGGPGTSFGLWFLVAFALIRRLQRR